MNRFLKLVIILISLVSLGCQASQWVTASASSSTVTIYSTPWASWTKWLDPVLEGPYSLDGDPSVMRDGGILRMIHTCFDPAKQGPVICESTSTDGFKWTLVNSGDTAVPGRVLKTGTGSWENTHETPFILKKDGVYYLYYSGYIDKGGAMNSFPAYLGLAKSTDAIHFKAVSTSPILKGTPKWYDSDAIFSPTITQHNGTYYMVYTGHCWNTCPLGKGVFLLGATSTDGIKWTKFSRPILSGSTMPPFFKQYAGESELVKGPDGLFYLFFSALQGDDPHMLAVGRSTGPFGPWEISPNPVVVATPGKFDESEVVAPAILIEGDKVQMWFSGFSKKPTISIGRAEAKWPLK